MLSGFAIPRGAHLLIQPGDKYGSLNSAANLPAADVRTRERRFVLDEDMAFRLTLSALNDRLELWLECYRWLAKTA